MTGVDTEPSEVSKHPVASIPDTDESLADITRKRTSPARWVIAAVLVIAALIGPYWLGRTLAVQDTDTVSSIISSITPQGLAFIGWAIMVVVFTGIVMAVVLTPAWPWVLLFAVALAVEQFFAGVCLFNFHFWYSTYVVYGDQSHHANALNAGLLAALVGIAIYAVVFIVLLLLIKKQSRFNELTRSWASFTIFLAIEVVVLMILLFSGLLNIV